MSVARICSRQVDTAYADSTVQVVAEQMERNTVGAIVIVDQDKKPIGIVTDRDLVGRVLAKGKSPETTVVRDVMTAHPKIASEDKPVEWALSTMRSGAFRRLPVVDEHGELSGIVTLDDILMLLAREFWDVGQLLEEETPKAVDRLYGQSI